MKMFKTMLIQLPFLMLLLLATQCATPECVDKSVSVLPSDFNAAMVANPDGYILDVRTPDEFANGHIEGANLLNFFDDNFEQQLELLDKNTEVFVYCKSGNRSGKTKHMLEQMCFKNIIELKTGFDGWSSKGMPSVK